MPPSRFAPRDFEIGSGWGGWLTVGGKGSGGARPVNPRKAQLPAKYRPGWLKRMDQRSEIARALNGRLIEITQQLGGFDDLSPMELSLIDRWIHIEAMASQFELRVREQQMKPAEVPTYLALVDRLHGIGKSLGLRRKARRVPTLREIAQEQS